MKQIMIYILSAITLFLLVALAMGYLLSAPRYEGPPSDNYDGKTFINPGRVKAKGFKDVLKWVTSRNPGPWSLVETKSTAKPPPARVSGPQALITFINHSTFLIQVENLNILTDPVWSDRVSPFSFAGPKRMRPPGVSYQDLPEIDYVIISHNHYDHLDKSTLKRLAKDHDPRFITPLGVGKYLKKIGLNADDDMDWWDTLPLTPSVNLHAVPAQHFSGRGLMDRDATLWCGYVLEVNDQNIYFAGDTGYGSFVHEIGKRFQPLNVALLPIGAYLPKWFMSPIHTSPKDAVQMHIDLQAQQSIGIHFGTFPLADDGMTRPIEDLHTALKDLAVPEGDFITLKEGNTYKMKLLLP